MLTPQDIQNKGFDKAVFGGYEMTAVDAFLEELQYDYEKLVNENNSLKAKVKELEAKVDSYHATEDSMRIALATAQKTSDDMIADAKEQCRTMLETANEEYGRKFAELNEQIQTEEDRLARACADTDKYIAAIRKLAEKQEEYLAGLRQVTDESRPANPPRQVAQRAQKIDDSKLPTIPDLEDLDDPDTDTAEEISFVVAEVLQEETAENKQQEAESADKTKAINTQRGKRNRNRNKNKKSNEQFDFESMQFNK